MVAPLAGAWIETFRIREKRKGKDVAPLAGAWIETPFRASLLTALSSHPSRVRGLKH